MSGSLLIALFVALGATLVQTGLALRAVLVERREGLRPSYRRLGVSAAVALLVAGLVSYAALARGRAGAPAAPPPATAPAPPARPLTPEQKTALEAKRAKLAELKQEVAALEQDIAALEQRPPAAEPEPKLPGEPAAVPLWIVFVVIGLLLAGLVFLLLGGDLDTLLPWRRRKQAAAAGGVEQAPSIDALAALAGAAAELRFADALEWSRKVHPEALARLELLDFLYLRAYSALAAALGVHPAGDETPPLAHDKRQAHLEEARADLARLLEIAPHMAEARYLKARTDAALGEHQQALEGYRASRAALGKLDLPFAHDESVCLLALAEKRLGAADSAGANQLFDEVTRLGVLAHQIPVSLITHRLLRVRECVRAGQLDEARRGLEALRQVEGLGEEQRRTAEVTCDVYDLLIHFKAGEHAETLAHTNAFLEKWLPPGLPAVEDQTADEYLFPAVNQEALPLPAELYRGFFFMLAVTMMSAASRRGQPLGPDENLGDRQPAPARAAVRAAPARRPGRAGRPVLLVRARQAAQGGRVARGRRGHGRAFARGARPPGARSPLRARAARAPGSVPRSLVALPRRRHGEPRDAARAGRGAGPLPGVPAHPARARPHVGVRRRARGAHRAGAAPARPLHPRRRQRRGAPPRPRGGAPTDGHPRRVPAAPGRSRGLVRTDRGAGAAGHPGGRKGRATMTRVGEGDAKQGPASPGEERRGPDFRRSLLGKLPKLEVRGWGVAETVRGEAASVDLASIMDLDADAFIEPLTAIVPPGREARADDGRGPRER